MKKVDIWYSRSGVEIRLHEPSIKELQDMNKFLHIKSNLEMMNLGATLPLFYYYQFVKPKKGVKYYLLMIYDEDIAIKFMKKFKIGDPVFYKMRWCGENG